MTTNTRTSSPLASSTSTSNDARADLRTTEELRALAAEGAELFATGPADKTPEERSDAVLAWAADTFGTKLAVACSMAADTVVPALVSRHIPGVDVLFLDTGYHFAETLETRDGFAEDWPVNLRTLLPLQTVAAQDAEFGPKLHDRDPGRCCAMRKVEPLDRALKGYEAWVTGLRREETPHRANALPVEWDEHHQIVKINAVVDWSFDDVIEWAQAHLVRVNPLLTQGYPSIGCAPCTRQVAPGEDPRAGRWAGLTKTECGIHL